MQILTNFDKEFLLLVVKDSISTNFCIQFHLKQISDLKLIYVVIHPCLIYPVRAEKLTRANFLTVKTQFLNDQIFSRPLVNAAEKGAEYHRVLFTVLHLHSKSNS